jgi:hypothetical protein
VPAEPYHVSLVAEIVVGWIVIFTLPKLALIPVFRALWRAMKASERQDELDAAWLADQRGDGGPPLRFRPRRPRRPPELPARRRAPVPQSRR